MKPSFGLAYLDNNIIKLETIVINIRASKNISGLVTSPAGLMKFFLNVEPSPAFQCMLGRLLSKAQGRKDSFNTI